MDRPRATTRELPIAALENRGDVSTIQPRPGQVAPSVQLCVMSPVAPVRAVPSHKYHTQHVQNVDIRRERMQALGTKTRCNSNETGATVTISQNQRLDLLSPRPSVRFRPWALLDAGHSIVMRVSGPSIRV